MVPFGLGFGFNEGRILNGEFNGWKRGIRNIFFWGC